MSKLNRKKRQRAIRDQRWRPNPPPAPMTTEVKAVRLAHQVAAHLIAIQEEIESDLVLVRELLAARRRTAKECHADEADRIERYTVAIKQANARIRANRRVLETTRSIAAAA